jgi:uncharacterized membrane protein YbhN (UPF0104 family)
VALLAAVGLVVLLVMPYIGNRLVSLLMLLPGVPKSVQKKLEDFARQMLRGIRALHHMPRATAFIFFTCIIWTMDGIGTILLARSLHLHLTLSQSFLLLTGLGLSSAIPSTPGYVGVYQFVASMVLTPFGISRENALAFILVFQIFNFLVIAIWGSLSLWVARRILVRNTTTINNPHT